MKRIGIYLSVTTEWGGIFQYCQSLIDAACSLDRTSYHFVFAYENPLWESYLKDTGIDYFQVKQHRIRRIIRNKVIGSGLPIKIGRLLCKRIDIFACELDRHDCELWIFPAIDNAFYTANSKMVGVIHDLMHRYEGHFPEVSDPKEYRNRELLFGSLCHYGKGVIVDSETGKKHVNESYGIDPSKIMPLPYIPAKYIINYNSVQNEVGEKYSLPEKFFFYPAQFWMHKNHNILINALKELKKRYPDICIVFVGHKKNGYNDIVDLIGSCQLQDNVRILGYVDENDIPDLYIKARALIMPTFFGPTNIPQLEAFTLGCPVATSKIYGIPEQVGDAALLFDPHSLEEVMQCMEKLWTDDMLCEDLVRKGKAHAEKWGICQFNDRFKSIIDYFISK